MTISSEVLKLMKKNLQNSTEQYVLKSVAQTKFFEHR